MNDEDILHYIHEIMTLDSDCQYEGFARRTGQQHVEDLERAPSLDPSPPRRSVRIRQQNTRCRHDARDEDDVGHEHDEQSL